MPEEPYERIVHVRICGEADRVTGRLYPEHRPKGGSSFELVLCSPDVHLVSDCKVRLSPLAG